MGRRRWREYRTVTGSRPLRDFFLALTREEAEEVSAAMKHVALEGLAVARHLRGEVYEVRAEGRTRSFRILFATEGRRGQVLLGLSAFVKKSQRTPPREIELAELRLADWRRRRRLPPPRVLH
ncbi:MAG: Phage derived protein Gp49-like [Pseudomonadota bacterium]|jgi:phage-related protein